MTHSAHARITFGIIVLNGEPFTKYCLRALYPYAHQIIVVEGAAPGAAPIATADGHSRDGTLETIRAFQAAEDPDRKVELVTREGFWTEKDEMSQAYAERATGDYLWQVDIDEFYRPEDMKAILTMLHEDPTITAVSFPQFTFWGGISYCVDGWYLLQGAAEYHRLFKWEPGYRYVTHRPPTVRDLNGTDLRSKHWVRSHVLASKRIALFHYSLLLPKQVEEKCAYYAHASWAKRQQAERWAQESFMHLHHPFRVHNVYEYPSWLERFSGSPPPVVNEMMADLAQNPDAVSIRQTADIERLLNSCGYRLGRAMLKALTPVSPFFMRIWRAWRKGLRMIRLAPREHI